MLGQPALFINILKQSRYQKKYSININYVDLSKFIKKVFLKTAINQNNIPANIDGTTITESNREKPAKAGLKVVPVSKSRSKKIAAARFAFVTAPITQTIILHEQYRINRSIITVPNMSMRGKTSGPALEMIERKCIRELVNVELNISKLKGIGNDTVIK